MNLGITKVYLIPCNEGYLLIDTGYPADYMKFRKKLAAVGVDVEEIKHLLLTHYHDDHVGFARKLKEEFGLPLILQKRSVPLLAKGDSGSEEGGQYITKRLKLLFSVFQLFHRSFRYPPVLTDGRDTLVDGDDDTVLRSLGIPARIIHTPGHTEDSMTLLFDDGTAFVGDAAMNFLKCTGTAYRPIYYTNEEKMYASIRRILSSGAKTIVPAHGNPYPAARLETMLNRFRGK